MRTKQVFPTEQIPHLWAHQKQDSARNPGGNLYYSGKEIFSYGRHFCIARLLDNGKVLFTNRTYSNTTAKHISAVRYAVNHLELIYCKDPSESTNYSVQDNLLDFQNQIQNELAILKNPRKRPATHDAARANLKSIMASIEAYLGAVGADEKRVRKDMGLYYKEFTLYREAATSEQAAESLQRKLDLKAKADERKRKKDQAEQIEKAKAELSKWMRGHTNQFRHYSHLDLPVRLRVDLRPADRDCNVTLKAIETSKGARVSYEAGKLLYGMIKAGRDVKGHDLDGYTVISMNGVLTIGCHKIERKEIERFAKKEGW